MLSSSFIKVNLQPLGNKVALSLNLDALPAKRLAFHLILVILRVSMRNQHAKYDKLIQFSKVKVYLHPM